VNAWIPIGLAAHLAGRSHRTIRTWIANGDIEQRTIRGCIHVSAHEALKKSAETPRRQRRRSDPTTR
jgi:hypothetical protein